MAPADHFQIDRRRLVRYLGAAMLGGPWPAQAQEPAWPTRSLRLIVPYPAGGAPDTSSRSIAEALGRNLGQSVVVENKPGGAGLIGVRSMTAQPYDGGHTLCYVGSGHVTLTAMSPQFDLLKETRLVSMVTRSPFVLVVHPSSPYKALQDLVGAMRAAPGKISYGTAGNGSPAHMATVFLEEALQGVVGLHVPYKGAVESANAILGQQIDFTVSVMGAMLPHIRAGRLRALGVTTAQRLGLLPNVPTIAEQGVPGYQYSPWGGIAMHRDTPDAVVNKVHAVLSQALTAESVRQTVQAMGTLLMSSSSPASFAQESAQEIERERQTVKRIGLDKLQS